MKTPVSDEAVREYAKLLRSGGPLAKVFSCPLSECDFSDQQRQIIREARHERKVTQRKLKGGQSSSISKLPLIRLPSKKPIATGRPLTKLLKLLYLQSGRCFFCGEELSEDQANIEHLVAKKWGGKSEEWNEVVCHASLNETFGSMDLKSKFAFVIKSAGKFRCPK